MYCDPANWATPALYSALVMYVTVCPGCLLQTVMATSDIRIKLYAEQHILWNSRLSIQFVIR